MGIPKMAWRNLWRRSRRTVVTIGAMTLALFVLVLYSGLVEGYMRNMERNILDLEFGDVQAYAGDYRDRPSIYTLIEAPEALLEGCDPKADAEGGKRRVERTFGEFRRVFRLPETVDADDRAVGRVAQVDEPDRFSHRAVPAAGAR